jgi:hypothetical protein
VAREYIDEISFRNYRPRRLVQFPVPRGAAPVSDATREAVFAGARLAIDPAKPVVVSEANVSAGGDDIVLAQEDGVEDYVAETLFGDPATDGTMQLVVDLTPVWEGRFDAIPALIDRSGYSQWDDFHGTGVLLLSGAVVPPGGVIPEPASGGLLAIGLAALALRRKHA